MKEQTPKEETSPETLQQVAKCYADSNSNSLWNKASELEQAVIFGANWQSKQPQQGVGDWISVEDHPLFTKDEKGNWTCTDAGDNEFIAAVNYSDAKQPGKDLWWIRHCVIEDERGLCVVGDDENEIAGWSMEDVLFYQPLPAPPNSITKPTNITDEQITSLAIELYGDDMEVNKHERNGFLVGYKKALGIK